MLIIQDPANLETLAELPEDHAASVREKYERARRFQPKWAKIPYPARAKAIENFSSLLAEHSEELARILSREMGKPLTQSRREIQGARGRIDFFLESTAALLQDEKVAEGELIQHEPLGVIANISAWNYPYLVGVNVFIPALLAGNAVLYKPSELAAMTGEKIQALLREAGIPADALITVTGGGRAGQDVASLPVDGVFFTGSYATGKKIAELCAPRMIRVQLELGGKDPAYICQDVNVPWAAAQIADGAFYNAGQSCCAIERVYVHADIHDDFVERFLSIARTLKMGDPLEETTTLGPLARAAQLDVLETQVRDALSKGAQLLCGGKRSGVNGAFFEPTVLIQVNGSMRLMQEESFGPIIGIQKVSGDEEAIREMNDTEYGLTAAVFTPDETRARQILSRVNAATAYWNCCDRVSPRLPWSGRKHSGMGSTLSKDGIHAFLRTKSWHLISART